MKKENFVETNEQSRGTLKEMIDSHDADPYAHPTMEQNFSTMVFDVHGNDFGAKQGEEKHISPEERLAWNRAADAAEKIEEAESYAKRAETAEEGAESARESAQTAYRSAIAEKNAAVQSASDAVAARDTAKSYIDDAKGIRDAVAGFKKSAERKADEAASDSRSAKSWAYSASEAAGNAARYANRAENAAKKAEALAEKVRNKADAGVTVESMDALPENASVGVVYTVKERVATNGYKVIGKVSDLFETDDLRNLGIDEEGKFVFAPKFNVPDECVVRSSLSNGDLIWVYSADGNIIGQMDYPYYDGMYPKFAHLSLFGADGIDDVITLYVAKLSQPMGLEPDHIEFEDVERAMYHNGESWVELASASVVDGKANSGQALSSMEELEALPLPGDVSEGVVYTVVDKKPVNGYKVTGKVSDLFYTGYGNEVGHTADEIYAYRLKVAVPDACVAEKDIGSGGIEKYVRIYKENGEVVAAYNREVTIDNPLGYPLYFLIENLGASSVDDIVTFYCGYAENGVHPDAIKFEEVGRAFYYNGNEWVELAPASAIGDIDSALDAILALDEKKLGGDA